MPGLFCLIGHGAWAASAPTVVTNADVLPLRLTMAACTAPPRLVITDKSSYWACDKPKDYFTGANGFEPDEIARHADGACTLAFDDPGGIQIYAGRFTEDAPQLLAIYHTGSCATGSTAGQAGIVHGGAALFHDDPKTPTLIAWYPGFVPDHCVTPSVGPGDTQRLYCITTTRTAQGDQDQSFGPTRLTTETGVRTQSWIAANRLGGAAANLIDCTAAQWGMNVLLDLDWHAQENVMVVDAAALDTKGVASACARAAKGDFSPDEQRLRVDHKPVLDPMGFLRPDERVYDKIVLRFSPDSPTPVVDHTSDTIDLP